MGYQIVVQPIVYWLKLTADNKNFIMLPLIIKKLKLDPGIISTPITVSLYIKPYYGGSYSLIEAGVQLSNDGVVLASPPPSTLIDPTQKYVLKAVNELCGFEYLEALIVNPFCPPDYNLSIDKSYCFKEEVTDAIAPTGPVDILVVRQFASYSSCGSYIYNPGYNINGTGTSVQIPLSNSFWRNGAVLCASNTTTEGPLNRTGLWAQTSLNNQDIGFGVCIDIAVGRTYYIGMGCDNFGIVKLDGNEIIHQDPAALGVQYSMDSQVTFKIWHIYPVNLVPGSHIIELIGHNDTGIAAMGMEIYDNTPAQIAAATDYPQLNLIFSTKDYSGQPVQIGSQNTGWSCPDGYSLQTCSSPFMCRRLVVTNVLY